MKVEFTVLLKVLLNAASVASRSASEIRPAIGLEPPKLQP